MLNMDVKEIFDTSFCEVTKKLVKLELKKVCDEEGKEEDKEKADLLSKGYREAIETHGCINSVVICQFSDELFRYIIDTMNNGVTPSEEEAPLFLNEYINIACGHAISRMNNLAGQSSRLSIPSFYQEGEPLEDKWIIHSGRWLSYRTEIGRLHIFINRRNAGKKRKYLICKAGRIQRAKIENLCEKYSFFVHVENCLVLRIYVSGDRLLVLHFKKIMNGESESEEYKIYYCR